MEDRALGSSMRKIVKKQQTLLAEIESAYAALSEELARIPVGLRSRRELTGMSALVSVSDLIAYQIGWGLALLRWYQGGLEGEAVSMPGDGFSSWDYGAIALHFYKKYAYDGAEEQEREFEKVAEAILEVVRREATRGNLDVCGVWDWCTLKSGKQWPLSKWVRVNTVAPYKRATTLLRTWRRSQP